jgi:Domain of unknown function (DUF5916)
VIPFIRLPGVPVLGALLLLLYGGAPAVGADAARAEALKSITIERTATPPVIDGQLDEALWSQPGQIVELYQVKPDDGTPGTERTELWFAYDDDAIYVAVKLWDPAAPDGLAATVMKHGAPLRDDDRIALLFDPFNSHRTGYRFETNANGVRNDQLVNGSINNNDWSVIWEVAARVHAGFWSAEFAIPFKSLPFDPRSDTWGLNVSRAIRRKGEETGWVTHDRNWGVSVAGSMSGLTGMKQGLGLDVVPGATLGTRNDRVLGKRYSKLSPSLDAYYRLTHSLNAAVTFNTDFSATEVDDRQVNLSRFSLFFPEKRDFFLADSELFEFGRLSSGGGNSNANNSAIGRAGMENGRPFFSRRLGLGPDGTPVDIEYGAKLSGRTGRWNIGALAIQQADYVPPSGPVQSSPLAVVARISANVLSESSVGGIATSGNPNSSDGNSLLGLDFNYRNSHWHDNHVVEGGLWAQQSRSRLLRGRDLAFGGNIALPSATGWRGELNLRELQENFNPALGFVNVRGVRQYALDIGHTHYFNGGRIHSLFSGVDLYRLDDLVRGGLLTQWINVRALKLSNKLDDLVALTFSAHRENVDVPFILYTDGPNLITVPAGRYRYGDTSLTYSSGRAHRVTGLATVSFGDFYDGSHVGIDSQLTLKQSRHFTLNASADWDRIRLPRGSFISRLLRLSTEVGFSTQLGWSSSIQYDNSSQLIGVQSRLYYLPKAGQKFSLVLNHAMQDLDRDRRFEATVSEFSVRASYTFRF